MNAGRAAVVYWIAAGLGWSLLGAGAACGQLGESRDQIARQYGAPVQHNARVREHRIIGGPAITGDVHRKDGLFVRVVYGRDACVQAEFTRCEGALLRPETEALLVRASDGLKWETMPASNAAIEFYRRSDGRALASWTPGLNGSLLIAADESGAIWQKLITESR